MRCLTCLIEGFEKDTDEKDDEFVEYERISPWNVSFLFLYTIWCRSDVSVSRKRSAVDPLSELSDDVTKKVLPLRYLEISFVGNEIRILSSTVTSINLLDPQILEKKGFDCCDHNKIGVLYVPCCSKNDWIFFSQSFLICKCVVCWRWRAIRVSFLVLLAHKSCNQYFLSLSCFYHFYRTLRWFLKYVSLIWWSSFLLPNWTLLIRIHVWSQRTVEALRKLLDVTHGSNDSEHGRRMRSYHDSQLEYFCSILSTPNIGSWDPEQLIRSVFQSW